MMFPSSGNPEEDARTAAAIRRREANLEEGLCPNGDSPLAPTAFGAVCPVCGFEGHGDRYNVAARNFYTRGPA